MSSEKVDGVGDAAGDIQRPTTLVALTASQRVRSLIKSLRPRQWTKNIFVLAALVFDNKLFQWQPLIASLIGVGVLCLLASAVYLINDSADVEADRQHPIKRHRPIARGDIAVPVALGIAFLLVVVGLGMAFALNVGFGLIGLAYFALTTLYSFKLKHIVVLDVIVLATGFVLRVAAGTVLVNAVRFSPWLLVCMSLLALLMGFGKRRQELMNLGGGSGTRAILREYNVPLLDQILSIVTGALIVSYMFYTFSAPQLPANHSMMLTIPFVLYGLFRYLYLVHVRNEGAAPDELALKDRPLQIAFILWAIAVIAILYWPYA
jgi:4-hydroxybenzoate polyprenyltransferase